MRGPRRSSRTSGRVAGMSAMSRPRRRGATKLSTLPKLKPAAFNPSVTSRARSPAARACMRAGISSENSSSKSSGTVTLRARRLSLALEPGFAAGFGERADAQNVRLPLGDADDTARIEQVEEMRGLDALIIGRQRQERVAAQERLAFGFGIGEVAQQRIGAGALEVEGRVFPLGLFEDVAVGIARAALGELGRNAIPIEIVDVLDALHIHREALEAIGDLG